MMKKLIVPATAIALLAACGHPLPKPVDPLKDTGMEPGRVLENADLRSYQQQPLGLVLSDNTRNLIQWQKQEMDRSDNGFIVTPLAARSDADDASQWNDPTGISTGVARVLQARFKNVTLVQDVDAAAASAAPLVAVLDIQARESGCSSTVSECMPTMQAQYTLVFIDVKARSQVAAIRSVGSSGYCDLQRGGDYYANHTRCNRDARNRALDAMRGKLAASLPDAPSRQDPAPQASAAGPVYLQRYEESRKTIESGSPAEMYSLGLRMENSGNTALAGEVYQAIVRRYPDSPYAAKALERQEALVAH
jgi:hypothetical protein